MKKVAGKTDLKNRSEKPIKKINHFLDEIEKVAEITKRIIQIIIGITIIIGIGVQVFSLIRNGKTDVLVLSNEVSIVLKIVAIGLIFSTAIELAYMLFTHGPDEAIDPVITAIAAILLLRIPAPTNSEPDISISRIAELFSYGVIIAILFLIRELYLNGELKRKKEDKSIEDIDNGV